jgi:curved DNA-binding protein
MDSALIFNKGQRRYGKSKMPTSNYYELLQISPNADHETIHRVFQFLAARLHPDNPDTGNADKFILLKQAYDILSNPVSRAEYDANFEKSEPEDIPLSTSFNFLDAVEGELNRRLAVMALLYMNRRTNPYTPEVSLAEVERRMGFPRDYLDFTTWYLARKGYLTRGDNSDFTITADGVDFVEAKRAEIPVLNRLLTSGVSLLDDN